MKNKKQIVSLMVAGLGLITGFMAHAGGRGAVAASPSSLDAQVINATAPNSLKCHDPFAAVLQEYNFAGNVRVCTQHGATGAGLFQLNMPFWSQAFRTALGYGKLLQLVRQHQDGHQSIAAINQGNLNSSAPAGNYQCSLRVANLDLDENGCQMVNLNGVVSKQPAGATQLSPAEAMEF